MTLYRQWGHRNSFLRNPCFILHFLKTDFMNMKKLSPVQYSQLLAEPITWQAERSQSVYMFTQYNTRQAWHASQFVPICSAATGSHIFQGYDNLLQAKNQGRKCHKFLLHWLSVRGEAHKFMVASVSFSNSIKTYGKLIKTIIFISK